MKSLKSMLLVLGSVSLIFLGACGNNNQAANSDSSPTTAQPSESTAQQTDATNTESSGHAAKPLAGSQVVAIALAQHHQHSVPTDTTSPYVEQLDSPVRGLSSQEVDDLLKGRGAGYARVAELNGYPGPRHVLDLKQELNLSTQQEWEIQIAFEQMQKEAERLGQVIVEREHKLSRDFTEQVITDTQLQRQTQELAKVYRNYGQLTFWHTYELLPCFLPSK